MSQSIIDIEQQFIYLLLHDKKLVGEFLESMLLSKDFDESHQFILKCIIECYDDDVLLTRDSLRNKAKSKIPIERVALETTINRCYNAQTDSNNFPTLVNQIYDHKLGKVINFGLAEFNKKLKDDKFEAIKYLVENFESTLYQNNSFASKTFYDDVTIIFDKNIQYLKDVRSGKIEEIPPIICGIKEIDDTMITGYEAGTLTLFIADVGGFKSTMMMNVALNVWRYGHNVLYVPLEMDKDQMWKRLCSRESCIPYEMFARDVKRLTDEQMEKIEAIKAEFESGESKFYIMQESKRTNVFTIQKNIERRIEEFKPKLVVIDYIANLDPDQKRNGRNDLEIGDMLKSLRHNGKTLGHAVVSGAQLGRAALNRIRLAGRNRDKTAINSEDVRGSHEYSADADNIYAQLKHVSQPNQLLDIYCVKARNGPNTFPNGELRATLEVRPEIFLVQSQGQGGMGEVSTDDILNDLNDLEEEDSVVVKSDVAEGSSSAAVSTVSTVSTVSIVSDEEDDWDF